MIGECLLLVIGFLLGRRAFWASVAYVLGTYQALVYPVKLIQFVFWLMFWFLPRRAITWIHGSLNEVMEQYGANPSDLNEVDMFF
ncbi:MAG: small hydrophobic protein [Wufeng bat tupavirus 2]|nr:MAG: small hydrophobic protein [Wufeng bat tupavirus 2]